MKKLIITFLTALLAATLLISCGKKEQCLEDTAIENSINKRNKEKDIENLREEYLKKNLEIDSTIKILDTQINNLDISLGQMTTLRRAYFIYGDDGYCINCYTADGSKYATNPYDKIVSDLNNKRNELLSLKSKLQTSKRTNEGDFKKKEDEIKRRIVYDAKINNTKCDKYKY